MKRDKRLRTLRTLQEDRRAWAEAAVPGVPLSGLTAHLRKEVTELDDAIAAGDHGQKHMELADILLLLLGVADAMQVSAEALIECGYTKLAIVKQRKHWEKQPDGSYHHVDADAPHSALGIPSSFNIRHSSFTP
jgi:NTP pyrophosphatase (non-canonical NTP hydrolase)